MGGIPLGIVAGLLAGCARREMGIAPQERKGMVVCLHGFLRTRANTWALSAALRRDGWKTLNWRYPSRSRTIADHAEALVGDLRKVAEAHPGEPIAFVTHSLGGLVVRAALNRPDCPQEALHGRIVLLAPPNRGSAMARKLSGLFPARWVFGNHAGRELMETPEDGFDRLGTFPEGVQVLVLAGDLGCNPWIMGPDDGKVGVEETALPTPHVLRRVHAGHSWIAWSPNVIREVRHFLTAKRLEEISKVLAAQPRVPEPPGLPGGGPGLEELEP